MASEKEVSIIVRVKDEASSQIEKLNASMGSFYSKGLEPATTASKALAVGLLGVGTAAVAFGGMAAKAAMDAQVQMASFDATLKTMGATAISHRDAILESAAAVTKLGFDDEDAAVSIAQLYQRTGDLTKATQYNSLAMDLARAKHMELSEASKMVGMVLSGNGKVLKQYGIEINDNLKPAEALGELQKKLAGQAEAYASTMAGQIDVFKNSWSNFLETVGDKLLPTLTKILEKVNDFVQNTLPKWIDTTRDVVQWLDKHRIVIALVAGAIIGGLVPALYAWATAMIPVIAAFAASAVALAPFLVGGAIVGGLIYGIVMLITHWDMVKQKVIDVWNSIPNNIKTAIEIVLAVLFPFIAVIVLIVKHWDDLKTATIDTWNAITGAIGSAWEFIKNATDLAVRFVAALIVGVFGLMGIDVVAIWQSIVLFLQQAWELIKGVFTAATKILGDSWHLFWTTTSSVLTTVWDSIKNTLQAGWDWILSGFNAFAAPFESAFSGMWERAANTVTSVWQSIENTVKGSINWIIDKINGFIAAVNRVASSGASKLGFSAPQIPEIPHLAKGGIVTKPTIALIGEAGAEAVVPLSRGGMAGAGMGGTIILQGNFYTAPEMAQEYGRYLADEIKRQLRI